MDKITFTTESRIVETGGIHPRTFHVGDTSSDPQVIEVAIRNGWADRVAKQESSAPTPAPPPVPVPAGQDDAPKPMVASKARKSAPENK